MLAVESLPPKPSFDATRKFGMSNILSLRHESYDETNEPPFSHIAILGQGRATVDAVKVTRGEFEGRVFARKSIRVNEVQRWKVVEALVTESHITARLPHTHICSVVFTYEYPLKGQTKSFGIVMGVVADMNLAEYLEEKESEMRDAGPGRRLPILKS